MRRSARSGLASEPVRRALLAAHLPQHPHPRRVYAVEVGAHRQHAPAVGPREDLGRQLEKIVGQARQRIVGLWCGR